MIELRNTVQRTTLELNDLMRELSATDDQRARDLVEQVLTTELMLDFKASVDAMRHLIWIYIEALAKAQGKEPATLTQSARLNKATEMLRALHLPGAPGQLATTMTFVEHVQGVVDKYQRDKEKRSKTA